MRPFRRPRPPQLLRDVGLTILVIGLFGSVWIWRHQERLMRESAVLQAADPAAPLPALLSRRQSRDIEIYYGKTGLLMEQVEEWFQDKGWAKTVAALSVVGALGCFWAAARWRE